MNRALIANRLDHDSPNLLSKTTCYFLVNSVGNHDVPAYTPYVLYVGGEESSCSARSSEQQLACAVKWAYYD